MADNHVRLGAENAMHENTRTTVRARLPLAVFVVCGVLATSSASASEATADEATGYEANWGPAVGATIPELDTRDSQGMSRDLASLTGERGLLLVVSRSAVW